MSLTGEPDGEPMRYPAPISDMTVGLYALIGILAALYERERTGRGQAIDAAILESQMGWLTNLAGSYFATGDNPPRMGNIHPTITPYQPFPTADGWIIIAGGTDRIWGRLCDAARHPARGPRRPALRHQPAAQRQPGRGPGDADRTVPDADPKPTGWSGCARPTCRPARSTCSARRWPTRRCWPATSSSSWSIRSPGSCARWASRRTCAPGAISYRLPPPTLGQHTEAVLSELGISAETVKGLRDLGIV